MLKAIWSFRPSMHCPHSANFTALVAVYPKYNRIWNIFTINRIGGRNRRVCDGNNNCALMVFKGSPLLLTHRTVPSPIPFDLVSVNPWLNSALWVSYRPVYRDESLPDNVRAQFPTRTLSCITAAKTHSLDALIMCNRGLSRTSSFITADSFVPKPMRLFK